MSDEARARTREGIGYYHQGRLAEAAWCFEEALRLAPDDAHGYNNLANIYLFQGRFEDAIANYRRALEMLPSNPDFYNHLSYAYSKYNMGKEAEQCARYALSLKPSFPEAYNHLAIALGILERYDEAEACYLEALRLAPGFAQAYSNLAQVKILQHQHDEAFKFAERAIQLDPNLAEAYATLAGVYVHHNMTPEAEAAAEQALRINPRLPDGHYHLATIRLKQDRIDEAVRMCREMLAAMPDQVNMEYVLGMAAMKENRLDDALAHFNKLLEKKPNDAQVHFNRALIWLVQGKYEEGWPEYEWRWKWPEFYIRPMTKPMWDGSSLEGKSIVLNSEQGMGDTFQFIRYAPLVQERGATVVLACPGRMMNLLSRCRGIDRFLAQETLTEVFDEHMPLMSLPSAFKASLATVPADIPYVFADPALEKSWRDELTTETGFRVGLAWQGNPQHPDDRHRSMPLEKFAPLARVPGVCLYSLQKGPGEDQTANAPFDIVDLAPRLDNSTGAFMDTAAVIKNLDLVITSDSAIAHLAGALGAPVWVALQYAPDFRWLLDRQDSPWYPTMRLFRQSRRGQWEDVFERIGEALAGEMQKRRS